MTKSKHAKRYSKEFHRQIGGAASDEANLSDLSREFRCSQWASSQWVKQAERDSDQGGGGPTIEEPKNSRSYAGRTSGYRSRGKSLGKPRLGLRRRPL
jgi:transposase-like protein